MRRRTFWILLIIMGLGIIGCNSAVKTDLIAEVNGEKISRVQWDERYQMMKNNYEAQSQSKIDEQKDQELVQKIRDAAFDNLILQALLRQDAKSKGITVADDDLNAQFEKLKASQAAAGADGFKQFLQANGMDEQQLREELKMQMLAGNIKGTETKGVNVNEEEIQKYYQANQASFKEAGGMQISHILVGSEKEARDILAQLKQGQDFAALAKKYSTCSSKDKGGDLGLVNQDTSFVAEFKAAALKLQPGEMTSEPVKTEFGYHIIKAGAKQEDRAQSFEEVKNQIMMNLQNEKQNTIFNAYLEDLKKKAEIKDYRQK
ncbi:MAG: SurA N-terminal domain-containing protein [Syntrophomonadaceae bacterium]|nr:SurA N-terminal domain-containing protein [Syntrophomonadaceae bacterium]